MSDNESVDYLQTGFDAKSLTVPRLRSILVAHNVQYPSTAKKPQLIDLFNEHVVPQSRKILAARARVKRMSKGIVDADSQESASMDDHDLMPPPTATRARSPRKSTRVKSESVDPEPEPSITATRESQRKRQSRSASAQAVGVSDTDSTDADVTRSTRKPRRVITATTPPVKLEPPREESFFKRTPETEGVFSSDNPFQSGGSSPPVPSRTPSGRRKTTGPESTKTKTPSNRRRTDGVFDSDLYRSADQVGQRLSDGAKTPQPLVVEAGEEFTPEAQLELQQEEAADPQRALLARAKLQPPAVRTKKSSFMANTLLGLLPVILIAYAAWYRQEKLAVGYCGLGRAPNQLLPIPDNLDLPDWAIALVEPQCEPCPPHAYCYEDFSVRCEQDFILKPHPLSLGGLVPLPPTCEPDGEKVRRVQAVADRAVEELRDRRAKYECGEPLAEEGPVVESPAIDEEELKETLAQKRSKRMSKDEFDDLWTAAIGEIKARDEVEVVVDEQPE
jgi:hypothetical protein